MEIKVKVESGIVHYEVYRDGQFYCSEDTKEEAIKAARQLESG